MVVGFRNSFQLTRNGAFNWYPKHMNSGIKQMQAKLRSVDCVIEMHDARIPMSGRNPTFSEQLIGNKPHIIVLNKVDLIQSKDKKRIKEIYEKYGCTNVVFTNCKNDRDEGLRKLPNIMVKLIDASERFGRSGVDEYNSMIIGVPNCGKSSFINQLRSKHMRTKGRAVKVGPSCGVTKCVHEKVKISLNPLMYLFDTPGILIPRINDPNVGMKLAACANLPDAQVGSLEICDFILYNLNQAKLFNYVKLFELDEPSDCIYTVLTKACVKRNYLNTFTDFETNTKKTKPNFEIIMTEFLAYFRKGEFGKFVLDYIGPGAKFDDTFMVQTDEFEESGKLIPHLQERISNFSKKVI